jgi:hypothetical protein
MKKNLEIIIERVEDINSGSKKKYIWEELDLIYLWFYPESDLFG